MTRNRLVHLPNYVKSAIALALWLSLLPPASVAGSSIGDATDCSARSFFTLIRATAFLGIVSNNDVGVQAAAQWFDAPQEMTINGFNFFAWIDEGDPAVEVTASVFLPDADGFPMGEALATTTLVVDNLFGTGNLTELRHIATFPAPVAVDGPYLLVVENDSVDVIQIVSSNFMTMDGQGDGFSSIFFTGSWRNGLNQTFGGMPFDADWLVTPQYETELRADFTTPAACLVAPGVIDFQSSSSNILTSRFYNAVLEDALTWDFGDGATGTGTEPQHSYAGTGPFAVELVGTLAPGDGTTCSDTRIQHVGQVPQNLGFDFSEDFTTFTVDFAASASFADSWQWEFGDGMSATEQNPSNTYPGIGPYTACVNASNLCGGATVAGVCDAVLEPFPELTITKTDGVAFQSPGATVTYTIVVQNIGGGDATGETVTDFMPAVLTGVSWTCTASLGASCTASGVGDISDLIDLDAGAMVTYIVVGTYEPPTGVEPLINTASVTVPPGDDGADNTSTDRTLSALLLIHTDGFESGDLSAWSMTIP